MTSESRRGRGLKPTDRRRRSAVLLSSAVGSALWVLHPAYGQALYWDSNGTTPGAGTTPTGTWGTSVFWNSDPTGGANGTFTATTGNTSNLTFCAGNDTTGNVTVTVSGTQLANSIAFATGMPTLSGGTITITNGGNITNSSGNPATIASTISQGTNSFSILGNSSIAFQTITGTGPFNATVGALGNSTAYTGTVTLAGSADNTYLTLVVDSGTVDLDKTTTTNFHSANLLTINGGTVQVDGQPSSGAIDYQIHGTLTVNGGSFDLNGIGAEQIGAIGGSGGNITNTDSGTTATLAITGGASYSGLITDGAGKVAILIPSGTATLSGNNTFSGGLVVSGGSLTMSGNNSFGAGNVTLFSGNLTLSGNNSLSIGAITDSGGNLSLTGTNTFSGGVTVKAGNVTFTNAAGFGSGNITLGDGANTGLAAAIFTASTLTVPNTIVSTGNGANTISVSSNAPVFTGNVALSNGLVINAVGNAVGNTYGQPTLSGAISGSGNLTLQTSGNNTNTKIYIGNATIASSLNNSGAIINSGTGNGTVYIYDNIGGNVISVIQNSATSQLSLYGNITLSNSLALTDNVAYTLPVSGLISGSGNLTNNGTGSGSTTLSGNISGSVGLIENSTTSQLILSTSNSFSGATTIKAGTISFSNANAFGTGNITLGDSANTGLAATLTSSGANYGVTNPIISTGNGTNTISVTSYNPIYSGPISLSNDLTLISNNSGGSILTESGNITGTGNLTLQVMNSSSGSSIILSGASINNAGTITDNGNSSATTATIISGNIGGNVTAIITNSTASPLSVTGNIALSSGLALTNNVGINLPVSGAISGSGNLTNNGAGAGSTTLSGNISGSVGLIENSTTSQLTLGGSNSFSGGITILAGNVSATTPSNLSTGNLSLGNSGNTGLAATLNFNPGSSVTVANPVYAFGNGTSTIYTQNFGPTYSGNITLSNSQNLILSTYGNGGSYAHPTFSGSISGTGNITLQSTEFGSPSTAATITLTGASINNAGTITNSGNNSATVTVSGNIGANVTGVIENSPTSTLYLQGSANTFTSGVTVSAGVLEFTTSSALGTGNITLASGSGSYAVLNGNLGGPYTYANPVFSNGAGVNEIMISNYNGTFTSAITLNNNLIIGAAGSYGQIAGINGGITGGGNLTFQDLGTDGRVYINVGGSPVNNTGMITNNGTDNLATNATVPYTTISAAIGGNVTGVIQNSPTSLLNLYGANTYSSATTILAGTLNVGNGTAGKLNGTTGTALTFGGTGTTNFDEASGSSQGMGNLTLSDGDATIKSTYVGGNTTLTFANVNARSTGATANFLESGGNATTNKIVLTDFGGVATPTGTLLDPGLFFNGSSYAAYNATTGYVRAYSYSSDANGVSTAGNTTFGTVSSTSNVQMTGAVTAQGNSTINTLNMSGSGNLTFVDNNETLVTSGILKSGNNSASIISGAGIEAPSNGELVIRTDAVNDALTINSPVVANGNNALTKSGVGTLTLGGTNTYTGLTSVDAGTLALSTSGNNNIGNSTAIAIAPGATLNVSGVTGTGGFTLASGQILGGRGTVTGNLTVASGSKVSAGFSSALGTGPSNINGILTTGNESWSAGGTYSWKISSAGGIGPGNSTTNNGGNPGIDWDDISMSALTVPSSGNFTIAPAGSITVAAGALGGYYNWVIAQTSSGNFTTPGTTNLLSGGSAAFALNTSGLTINGVSNPSSSLFTLELINVSGSNDDLVLGYNSAPEPGTALLLLTGAAPLLMGRRRRAKKHSCMSVPTESSA